MWLLPLWAIGVHALNLIYGVASGQTPPPPLISAPIFAALASVVPLLSVPRFFGRGMPS